MNLFIDTNILFCKTCGNCCMCLCGAECQYRDAVETVNGERDKWENEMKQFAKVHTVNIYLLTLSCRCM